VFQHILIPLDLTDKHRQAVLIGAELATQSRGTVTLLHIIEKIPGLSDEEDKTFYARLERTARDHLVNYGESLKVRQVTAHLEVYCGQRAAEIARYAREKGVDLIILTAPHLDPQNPAAGWGSMSYRVGILAPCPVLLVK
jgi:nucleotide-binding universal stress UspA family protein